jgi:hypothetical protein
MLAYDTKKCNAVTNTRIFFRKKIKKGQSRFQQCGSFECLTGDRQFKIWFKISSNADVPIYLTLAVDFAQVNFIVMPILI